MTDIQKKQLVELQKMVDLCCEIVKIESVFIRFTNAKQAECVVKFGTHFYINYPYKWLYRKVNTIVHIAHEVAHVKFYKLYKRLAHNINLHEIESKILFEFGIRPIYKNKYKYAICYADLNGEIMYNSFGVIIDNNKFKENELLILCY